MSTNKLSSCPGIRVSANSVPNCLQSATPADALGYAQASAAFLQRVAEWQAQDGEGLTVQETSGLLLCHALLADKLAQAAGESAMPFVSFSADAPSLDEVLQAGAQVLEHRKALTDAVDRVEGLAGLLEDMADDARMFVRQDEDLLADALRTRAKALREAVSSLRAALPQVEQPSAPAKGVAHG